jgi:hypothetical protein
MYREFVLHTLQIYETYNAYIKVNSDASHSMVKASLMLAELF